MPSTGNPARCARQGGWAIVAFVCAAFATPGGPAAGLQGSPVGPGPTALGSPLSAVGESDPKRPKPPRRGGSRAARGKPKPAQAAQPGATEESPAGTQVESQPGEETAAGARRRLARVRPDKRSAAEHALLAGLEFALAVGHADGSRAAKLVDAAGYQPLPLEGELPEKPAKPLLGKEVGEFVADRRPTAVDSLPLHCFQVFTREQLRGEFPAVATWMLPQDRAVVLRPAADGDVPHWITRPACLVVRIRANKATILGGNLLGVLADDAAGMLPEGEDK